MSVAEQSDLPPEFEPLLQLLQEQPERVKELFHYAIVLLMIDDEKARIVETQSENGITIWLVQTIAGEEFSIICSVISEEVEQTLLERVRQIVAEDSALDG